MAKEDFCFTYYDGDAARDMAHMNRLERGCYTDVIMSIRKFGHLTLAQIKKILSKDFDECWPSIELILKIDQEEKYFIEWVENSIKKGRAHSKKQKGNIEKRWEEKKNCSKNTEKVIPWYQSGIDLVIPLEDVYGNEDVNKNDFGKSENLWTTEKKLFLNDFRWKEKFCRDKNITQPDLEKWMHEFLADLELKEDLKELKELKSHFTNWYNKIKNGKRITENSPKLSASEARAKANADY